MQAPIKGRPNTGMPVPLDKIRPSKLQPITALKIFMFFFVGAVIGLGYDLLDGWSSLVPLVIVLAGLGAVACVETFDRLAKNAARLNAAPIFSDRASSSAEHPESGDEDHVSGSQTQQEHEGPGCSAVLEGERAEVGR